LLFIIGWGEHSDEKIIIYSSDRPGGSGGADLYISWKKADGTWSESRNLGEPVNSEFAEYGKE